MRCRRARASADVKAELEGSLRRTCGAQVLVSAQRWLALDALLKDVIDRAVDIEMAYNPNDCVELRWGAPERSPEASTCKRHAPSAQRAKMTQYRSWFHERYWPHA